MVFAVAAYAQTPMAADTGYQVTYMSNLGIGTSVVNVTNTGANGAGPGQGTTAAVTGSLCANFYVFAPDEEIVSCCSCPVTPNGLVSLDAQKDLISNPLLNHTAPTSIVIKMVASIPTNPTCAGSAAGILVGAATVPPEGLAAWATKLHANTAPVAGYAVTETPFTPSMLSAGERSRLSYTCGIVANQGSGSGVCASCRQGGLGAASK
jgi:hypothetical protein